jgi:hypothetical protein
VAGIALGQVAADLLEQAYELGESWGAGALGPAGEPAFEFHAGGASRFGSGQEVFDGVGAQADFTGGLAQGDGSQFVFQLGSQESRRNGGDGRRDAPLFRGHGRRAP